MHLFRSGGSHLRLESSSNEELQEISFKTVAGRTGRIVSSYGNPAAHTGTYIAFHTNVAGGSNDVVPETMRIYSGNVGIGTVSPSARLNVVSTTEQLRLGYDASNYWSSTVGSTGALTMAGTGTGGSLTLTPTAGQNLNVSLSTTGDFAVNTSQLYTDTSTGNVGIGTTAPNAPIHVLGGASAQARAIVADFTVGATGRSGSVILRSAYDTVGSIDAWRLAPFGAGGGYVNDANYLGFQSTAADSGGIASSWNTNMVITQSGNVGIGTTGPKEHLDVRRTDNTTGTAIRFGTQGYAMGTLGENAGTNSVLIGNNYDSASSYIQFILRQSGTPVTSMTIKGDGNVGIGTTAPTSHLDVASSASSVIQVRTTDTTGDTPAVRVGQSNNYYGELFYDSTGDYLGLRSVNNGTPNSGIYFPYTSGNVGIGTTDPGSYKLNVSGTTYLGGATTVAGNLIPSANDTYDLGSDTARWANAWLGGETIHVGTADADEGEIGYTTATNVMTVQSNGNLALQASGGNVGIGTTDPGAYKLNVNGSINATSVLVNGVAVGGGSSQWTTQGTSIYYNTGNVGIGTTNPGYTLQIQSASAAVASIFGADGSQNAINMGVDTNNRWSIFSNNAGGGRNLGIYEDHSGVSGSSGTRFVIAPGGNVGIGTTAPGQKVDVSGGSVRTDNQLISTVATGTAPLAVSSTTSVSNLNADMLDGQHSSAFVQTSDATAGDWIIYNSDVPSLGSDPEVTYSTFTCTTSYAKFREAKLGRGGTYRISFSLTSPAGGYSYAKIYRNGTAVGTERATQSQTFTTFTEDISGWSTGDLLQIYFKHQYNGGYWAGFNRFYVKVNNPILEISRNASYSPLAYSWNGTEYTKETKIVGGFDSKDKESVMYNDLNYIEQLDSLKIKLTEEEDEIAHIDKLQLAVVDDGIEVALLNPKKASRDLEKLLESDGQYLDFSKGEDVYLEFEDAPRKREGVNRKIQIKAKGYYEKVDEFSLESGDSINTNFNLKESSVLGPAKLQQGYNVEELKNQIFETDMNNGDERSKENQQILSYGLNELMLMTPKQYTQISTFLQNGTLVQDRNKTQETFGFIAQELYQLIPQAVKKPKEGSDGLWEIDYSKIVPIVVKSIQEQQAEISKINGQWIMVNGEIEVKALSTEVLSQKLKVESLLTRMDNLEATNTANSNTLSQLEQRLAELEQMEKEDNSQFPISNEDSDASVVADNHLPEGEEVADSVLEQSTALSLSDQLQGEVIANLNVKNLTVVENVIVAGDIKVEGHIIAGEDTAGEVVVPTGENKVKIEFKKPYLGQPIVTATLSGGKNLFYSVKNIDSNGFEIVIDGVIRNTETGMKLIEGEEIKALDFGEAVKFNWQAMERSATNPDIQNP